MERWIKSNPDIKLGESFGFNYPKRSELTAKKYQERFGEMGVELLAISRTVAREAMRERKKSLAEATRRPDRAA
jgi:hypothetical protein